MIPTHSIIFLSVLVTVIVGSIFLFNLDDRVFGTSKPLQVKKELQFLATSQPMVQKTDDNKFVQVKENPIKEAAYNDKISEKNLDKPKLNQITPLELYKLEKYQKLQEEEKNKKLIKNLEKNFFLLEGNGRGWEGAPHLSKPSKISLKLMPVKDSDLKKFELVEGKISVDDFAINLQRGTVEINKSEIILMISSNSKPSGLSTIKGTINSSLVHDGFLGNVKFHNQEFVLIKGDKIPFHLSFDATLTSKT